MLIPLTLPPPVRQFLLDGLQLLIHRLAALTEEFRAGLIAAIGRTLADGAEHVMDSVIPQGRSPRVHQTEYDDDQFVEPVHHNGEPPIELRPTQPFFEEPRPDNPSSSPMTRAFIAAGLNALGVWLLRIGAVPTSAVIAVLGGMMLMLRR